MCPCIAGLDKGSIKLNIISAEAVSSTAVVFLLFSLLTCIFGFICGYYFGRKSKQPSTETSTQDHPSADHDQPEPLYEYVIMIPNAVEHPEQGLELQLNENVAYIGPTKSARTSTNNDEDKQEMELKDNV